MVNVDGIKTPDEEETSPVTLAVLADMTGDETPKECPPIQYEILMAALARKTECEGSSRMPRERCQASLRQTQGEKQSSKGSDST